MLELLRGLLDASAVRGLFSGGQVAVFESLRARVNSTHRAAAVHERARQ